MLAAHEKGLARRSRALRTCCLRGALVRRVPRPSQDNLPPPPPPPSPPPSSLASRGDRDDDGSTAPTSSAPVAPPASPVTLGPGAKAPDPDKPFPTVKIVAPTRDQVVPGDKANDFIVKLDVKKLADRRRQARTCT